MELISQGAEAILERDGNFLYKKRIPKNYRIDEIDYTLRKSRTKREIKVLQKAKELGIAVPQVYDFNDDFIIKMDFIDGVRLRDRIEQSTAGVDQLIVVGEWLAKLHDATIVHGDLTTSNVIMTNGDELFLIDFGLSFFTTKIEDKAVDIHLLEQALESTHYKEKEQLFEAFLKGYSKSETYYDVIERLDVVRSRGRNKH